VVVIVASFTKADADNLHPFTEGVKGPGGASGIFQALALSYHAYVGYDALTNAAEEVRPAAQLTRVVSCLCPVYAWWSSGGHGLAWLHSMMLLAVSLHGTAFLAWRGMSWHGLNALAFLHCLSCCFI
jgi:hypothetical protein